MIELAMVRAFDTALRATGVIASPAHRRQLRRERDENAGVEDMV